MKLLVILAALAATLAPAQTWQQFGPSGISAASVARVPGAVMQLYVATDGVPARVLHTSDAGGTWTLLPDTIPGRAVDLVVDPDQTTTLYLGTEDGRVWRSLDGGWTWFERGTLPGVSLRRLALKPGSPQVLRAAVEVPGLNGSIGLGFRVSTDGGVSWSGALLDSGSTVAARLIGSDPRRPNRVFLGGSVDGETRLFTSDNDGGTWENITGALAGECAWAAAASPVNWDVFLAATDSGIWRSTNAGSSWNRVKNVPAWSVGFAAASPHYAYAGSDNLVYRSNDLGLTWFADTTDFAGTATRWLEVNPLDGLDIYAASGRGVFRTTNGGFDWDEITTGLSRQTVEFLNFHPTAVESLFTCPPGHGILVSGNFGVSWEPLPGFAGAGFTTAITLSPAAPDTLYAVTSDDYRLYMTSDRGDSWTRQPVEVGFSGRGLMVHPAGPDTFYTWGSVTAPGNEERFGFWKSTNRGHNWTRVFSPGTSGRCVGFLASENLDSLFLWGSVDGLARVYLSTDSGGTWLTRSTGLGGSRVADFKPAPGDNRTSYVCATDAGVYLTINSGVNWTRLGLSDVTGVLPDTIDPDLIFAVTDTQGLFRTTDGGAFWERDTVELPHRSLTFLQRHPDDDTRVYCGTVGWGMHGQGVIGISEPERPAPRGRPLDVVPTVVRTAARLRLDGLAGVPVVVEFFTPDGRRVGPPTTLDPAPPAWLWTRPRELPAGVYLLRVRSSGPERTARIILTD